ncbi:MAG: peptidoglycan-binding protein [Spirulina sp.]
MAMIPSELMEPLAQADVPAPEMPSPGVTPNPVLLGPGSNPEEVRILQRQLTELGFYTGPLDGDYSSVLQEAVKTFQGSVDLPATGLLDRQTWERMSTPQLLSDASPAQGPTEVPNLLPSRPEEPLPSADGAPTDTPSVVSSPAPASTAPEGTTRPPGSLPPASLPDGADADAVARAPWRWRWLLLLPASGGAVWGLRWGWRRLRRSPLPAGTAFQPLAGARESEEMKGHMDPDPPPALPLVSSSLASLEAEMSQATPPEAEKSRRQEARIAQRSEVARLPTVNIVETLVNELRSTEASVRQRAIWELGQRGNSTAIQPLINSLMEADSQEKSLIFAALTEIGRRSLQPMQGALALGLQDPSPEVRKNALRDLSRLYDSLGQISPLLIHAAQDPDPEVQAIAHWALGQLNRLAPAPYLEASVEPLSSGDRLPPAPP